MPMQVRAYEHPIKSGARRVVRQIFLSWFIASIVLFCSFLLFAPPAQSQYHTVTSQDYVGGIFRSCFMGALTAVPLWLLYRLIRFAISR